MNRSTLQVIVLVILWCAAIAIWVQAARASESTEGNLSLIYPFHKLFPTEDQTSPTDKSDKSDGMICLPYRGYMLCEADPNKNVGQAEPEEDDINKAKKICEAHSLIEGGGDNASRDFVQGWGACYKIQNAWRKRELSKKMEQEIMADQKDKDFVRGVAEKQDTK